MRISSLERKSDRKKKTPQNVVSSMKNVFVEYVFIVFVIFSVCVTDAVAAKRLLCAAKLKELRACLHACMRVYSKVFHRYICMCVRN